MNFFRQLLALPAQFAVLKGQVQTMALTQAELAAKEAANEAALAALLLKVQAYFTPGAVVLSGADTDAAGAALDKDAATIAQIDALIPVVAPVAATTTDTAISTTDEATQEAPPPVV